MSTTQHCLPYKFTWNSLAFTLFFGTRLILDVNSQSHYVNGFIQLTFEPKALTLLPGTIATGLVNISLRRPPRSTLAQPIREFHDGTWYTQTVDVTVCCVDESIARLVTSSEYVISKAMRLDDPEDHWMRIGIEGIGLGRTTVKFYVTKRCPTG